MYRVSDIMPMVVDKLRGRSDLSGYGGSLGSNIPSWIHNAITDLTPNFPFEELVVSNAPVVNFVVGQNTYPINFFLAENGPPFSVVRAFFRYFVTSLTTSQTGITGSILKSRVTSVVYPMSVIPGLPVFWCQNNNSILFGFNPDQSYCVQMMYQRIHPFNLAQLPNDVIYMPPDWKEVLAYAAAIKGCEYLGMNDIAMDYYKKLHGDPKKPGNIGLLMEKASQLQRNITQNERQMQPVVHSYQY
jgi:hypothetical protein